MGRVLQASTKCVPYQKPQIHQAGGDSGSPYDSMIVSPGSDYPLPLVAQFKYLGSIINNDGEIEKDVTHRITTGSMKLRQLTDVMCDRKMPVKIKGHLRLDLLFCMESNAEQPTKINHTQQKCACFADSTTTNKTKFAPHRPSRPPTSAAARPLPAQVETSVLRVESISLERSAGERTAIALPSNAKIPGLNPDDRNYCVFLTEVKLKYSFDASKTTPSHGLRTLRPLCLQVTPRSMVSAATAVSKRVFRPLDRAPVNRVCLKRTSLSSADVTTPRAVRGVPPYGASKIYIRTRREDVRAHLVPPRGRCGTAPSVRLSAAAGGGPECPKSSSPLARDVSVSFVQIEILSER
ncbi:hypothetical protein EVAR_47760_1 [Eumeta japonica]|uniref:Uncharacterized protein n=1 Tax=Eumeta variegata TaxID=151549 RepID=A0A4C1XTF8_EUMVA|nr:hypothetical protein EVAR_47760_1 [Eumeta japonica]